MNSATGSSTARPETDSKYAHPLLCPTHMRAEREEGGKPCLLCRTRNTSSQSLDLCNYCSVESELCAFHECDNHKEESEWVHPVEAAQPLDHADDDQLGDEYGDGGGYPASAIAPELQIQGVDPDQPAATLTRDPQFDHPNFSGSPAATSGLRQEEDVRVPHPGGTAGAMRTPSKRGFASMDPQRQKEVASRGGKSAHAKGTAHEYTTEEARESGRKGGLAVSRDSNHMAEIGARGGKARARKLASPQS